MLDQLLEYGKQTLNKIVKNGIKSILKNPYVIGGIAVGCVAFVLIAGLVGGELETDAAEKEMQNATGSSWEQFIRYMITKEGGSHDDTNYWVEDDGYGVPTIGHGLALYNDGHGHKAEFEAYGIDTVELVKKYKANPSAKNATVSIEICDEIYGNHIKGLYEGVLSSYESYNLKEYQYYALTDVKYRRGNLGSSKGTSGFSTDYKNLWSDSDNAYGNYVESNENFDSANTLFHFFWDGGHSLKGVRIRKHDQWVIFKYGYYRPLKEYWKEGGEASGDYKADKNYESTGIYGTFTRDDGKTFKIMAQVYVSNKHKLESGWGGYCNKATAVNIASGYTSTDFWKMAQKSEKRERDYECRIIKSIFL